MELTCKECGHSWESRKDSLDEFADGPRCSSCDARDVVVASTPALGEEAPSEAAAVFEALESGASLVEIVREDICGDPTQVEEYASHYERLSDYQLVSDQDLEELRSEAYDNGVEAAQSKARRRKAKARNLIGDLQRENDGLRERVNSLETRLTYEYQKGWDEGQSALREEIADEYDTRLQDRLEKQREQFEAELAEKMEKAEKRGFERGIEKSHQKEYELGYADAMDDVENERMGAVYTEGLDHGVIIGAREGVEEGKAEGVKLTIGALKG